MCHNNEMINIFYLCEVAIGKRIELKKNICTSNNLAKQIVLPNVIQKLIKLYFENLAHNIMFILCFKVHRSSNYETLDHLGLHVKVIKKSK